MIMLLATGFLTRGFLFSAIRNLTVVTRFNSILKLSVFTGFIWVSSVMAATKPLIHFENDQVEAMNLEVVQKPLPDVLELIAKKANITVHFSGLPETPISATCTADNTKQILECLLDKRADLVFRYGQSATDANNRLAEVWILGTSNGNAKGLTKEKVITVSTKVDTKNSNPLLQQFDENGINTLLAMAQANDPEDRRNAIATLALQDQTKNILVRNTLTKALTDKSAEVRAQAVFALAKFDDSNVSADLESALQDNDVSVRLMVVDSADNHPSLLKLALNDSDESVRAAAGYKLETLAEK